ncbi:hypothetical protein ICV35_22540 [Rhodococcus ruber]|uniref:hypothetical protein n=1 Tax=Rhodococcus ruber TaxID=1830 RepID=UPI001786AAEF|nr:hypothetical protein [Rhodococcus ruber]MBD8056434.1 hypothetical protein [Rhodococcus ruber]
MSTEHTVAGADGRAEVIMRRAEVLGHDFAAVIRHVSTGPNISDLLRRYTQLLRDAEAGGVPTSRIEAVIDAATDHA